MNDIGAAELKMLSEHWIHIVWQEKWGKYPLIIKIRYNPTCNQVCKR